MKNKRYSKCNFLIISFLIIITFASILYCHYLDSQNDIEKTKMILIIDKQQLSIDSFRRAFDLRECN